MGQRAAAEALGRRWEQSDIGVQEQCGQCGSRLRNLGLRKKVLQTVCGPVVIQRRVGYCRGCRRTDVPLDRRLGTEKTTITPGLMRVICRVALELAYEQSESLLTDTLGFQPCSAREIERMAKKHGAEMDPGKAVMKSFKKSRRSRLYCLAIDGTMIPGLPDPQAHRLVWHEVKLATVFDPKGIGSSFYVAGQEDVEQFRQRLWNELQVRGINAEGLLLVLGDGASWIWNLADTCFPGVAQMLDFYHAAEHLHQTAVALWKQPTQNTWWQRRLDQLKQGQLSNFFAALQLSARRHTTSDPEVSPERLLKYFTDNRQRLNYQWALDNSLPIGSGTVESAARHIVQQRLKQSGMRWSRPGAQAVLNLRTCHRNGEFEQYWENYAETG